MWTHAVASCNRCGRGSAACWWVFGQVAVVGLGRFHSLRGHVKLSAAWAPVVLGWGSWQHVGAICVASWFGGVWGVGPQAFRLATVGKCECGASASSLQRTFAQGSQSPAMWRFCGVLLLLTVGCQADRHNLPPGNQCFIFLLACRFCLSSRICVQA